MSYNHIQCNIGLCLFVHTNLWWVYYSIAGRQSDKQTESIEDKKKLRIKSIIKNENEKWSNYIYIHLKFMLSSLMFVCFCLICCFFFSLSIHIFLWKTGIFKFIISNLDEVFVVSRGGVKEWAIWGRRDGMFTSHCTLIHCIVRWCWEIPSTSPCLCQAKAMHRKWNYFRSSLSFINIENEDEDSSCVLFLQCLMSSSADVLVQREKGKVEMLKLQTKQLRQNERPRWRLRRVNPSLAFSNN